MNSIFIDPSEQIAVTLDDNTIFVRSQIDFATYAKIEEGLMKLEMTTARQSQNGKAKTDEDVTIGARYTKSGQRLAVLEECVVDWEGPKFTDKHGRKVPCTRAQIRRLNPHDPLVQRVLEEIDSRNQEPDAPPVAVKDESDDPNV